MTIVQLAIVALTYIILATGEILSLLSSVIESYVVFCLLSLEMYESVTQSGHPSVSF